MIPIRILQVVMIMDRGGEETMLMNYYRKLDKSKYQFDFLVHRETKGAYDDEIWAMGGRIFIAPHIIPGNYHKYKRFLINFLQSHPEYTAIHSHIQENSGFILYYAKKYLPGCTRVSHSHVAKISYDLKYPFRLYAKRYLNKANAIHLACGEQAGRLFYGNNDFTIFKNAIDVQSFMYSVESRTNIRNELGVADYEILIGSVARFSPQKNHDFMVDLCEALGSPYKIVTVGMGLLLEKIQQKVKDKGLDDKFIFVGLRTDVARFLSAMDIFIMPSLYEGLPVSGIEAQANGLQCLFSDQVDTGTDVTGNCKFLPLDLEIWVNQIRQTNTIRIDTIDTIRQAGYDVETNLDGLLDIYCGNR